MLCNTYNSIWHQSFVCLQSTGFKNSKWLNSSIWSIDRTLRDTTTPDRSELESNGHKGALYIPQNFRTGASSSDGLVIYPGDLMMEVLLLCRDAFGVFYSPILLGWYLIEIGCWGFTEIFMQTLSRFEIMKEEKGNQVNFRIGKNTLKIVMD